jgi:fibronectin-binding autotransporter adhesin
MIKRNPLVKSSVLFTTALTTSLLGYYKRAYSACSNIGGTSYLCADTNTSTISLGKDNADVTTDNSFGLNVDSGDGIIISGDGALSFTDNYNSSITTNNPNVKKALYLRSTGDVNGINGSINVNINSVIDASGSGSYERSTGLYTYNKGSGANNVEFDGTINSNQAGIWSRSIGSGDTSITTSSGSTIDTTAGENASSLGIGILAQGHGSGDVAITVNGNVHSQFVGVAAGIATSSPGNIDITIGSESSITASVLGVQAQAYGNGTSNVNITTGGNITADRSTAINVSKSNSTIIAESGSNTSGFTGIKITSNNTSNLTLDGSTDVVSVTGTGGAAIEFNDADDKLTINGEVLIAGDSYGAGGTDTLNLNNVDLTTSTTTFHSFENINIASSNLDNGVNISNFASGSEININNAGSASTNLTITNSNISSSGNAIDIWQTVENDFSLTLDSDSTLQGDNLGISSFSASSNGSVEINLNGDVTSSGSGVFTITSSKLNTNINLGSNSSIYGVRSGLVMVGYSPSGQTTFNIDGTIISPKVGASLSTFEGDAIVNVGVDAFIQGGSDYALSVSTLGKNDLTINISGELVSTDSSALYVHRAANIANITIENGAILRGAQAITFNDVVDIQSNVSLDGTSAAISLTGTSGTAITFDQEDDVLSITGDVSLAGNVNGGDGYDSLNINNANLTLSSTSFDNFETIDVSGSNIHATSGDGLAINNSVATATALTISTSNITSDLGHGINYSGVSGSSLDLTFGAGSSITSYLNGLNIATNPLNNLALAIDGNITSEAIGINISQSVENDFSFNIGSDSVIIAEQHALNIAIDGDFTAAALNINGSLTSNSGSAIYASSAANGLNIILQNGGSLSGNKAISTGSDEIAFNITLDGSSSEVFVIGTGGTAIELGAQNDTISIIGKASISGDINTGAGDDTISMSGDISIEGNVDAGEGNDTITFNNAKLTQSSGTLLNFETIESYGLNYLIGTFDFSDADVVIKDGSELYLNGKAYANSFIISSGGVMSGNENLEANIIVDTDGTISPGNSVGTITTTTTALFNFASSFEAEIDSSGSDLVAAAGVTTISPGANLKLSSLDGTSGSGVILRAESIIGSFENITSSGTNLFTTYHNPTNTAITLVSLNPSTLTTQIQSSANSSILFNDTLNDQIADGALTKGKNFWIRNINRDSSISQPNNEFRNKSNGIALGAQIDVSDSYKLGFSLSQIHNNSKAKDTTGFKTTESTFASIYGIYDRDLSARVKFFTSLSLGFGYHDNDASRLVHNGGISSYANSKSDDYDYSATLQIGSKIKIKKGYFITPRVSASYIQTVAGGFNEESGGASAVKINDYDFSTLKTRESVRFGKDGAINTNLLNNSLSLSPYIEVGFAQEDGLGDRTLNGQFIDGSKFTTQLREDSRNFTTAAVGINAKINSNISAFVSYENSSSNDENRNEVKGGLRVKF